MSTVRGSLGRLAIGNSSNCNYLYSAFSTFSGGGRGRGGGGFGPPNPQLGGAGKSEPLDGDNNGGDEFNSVPSGLGHGRGKPIIPAANSQVPPTFSSWIPGVNPPSVGRGKPIQQQAPPQEQLQSAQPRPRFSQQQQQQRQAPPQEPLQSAQPLPRLSQQQQQQAPPKSSLSQDESQSFPPIKPISFTRQDSSELNQNALPGAGRGKTIKMSGNEERPQEQNRHIRPPRQPAGDSREGKFESQQRPNRASTPKLSHEDATKRAVEILSRGGGGGPAGSEGGRGFRGGRGGRGRGRGGRGGRGRGGFGDEEEEDIDSALVLGDNADGEKLASKLGPDKMNQLAEGFEEICTRVLPSQMDEAYMDALHRNNLIEFEPEYLMGDFNSNPDIDEKPSVPIREKLEKVKPFLMAYEGIQSQEEWEKIVEETMEKVPQMEKLIDMYSGSDVVTAKEQKQELERIAAILPEKAPSSVKRFSSNAALTLQNNPGWGFEKKRQFMNMLGREVSKSCK
ncbi:hypothetical protein C5167_025465 [Papaver somniferum]|uniref:Hydroxyproline-rich glycoprotein family protein n=1 Tax=Papaver somniferum TaxID=3469 RepID=A0A4Y7JRJ7_PAPSO|nr:la-related protein 1-like [Papaver somniferum]RZC63714.1 hypothetical protein C5167_025465 [Papaver somniferum]